MLPLPLPPPIGTIWLSKTTTAVTRKAIGTRLVKSGLPVFGSFGTPTRRSVPPGPTCSRAASCGSIIAWPGVSGSYGRPCSTFTLSVAMPTP